MDQRLEDIDPDARKKYDRDMKQQAKEVEANEKKANASAKKAGYPSAEAEEKALRQKAIEELTNKKGTNLNKEAARGGGGGGGMGIPKVGPKRPLDMKKGGKVSSASKRADGCAVRGKTRA